MNDRRKELLSFGRVLKESRKNKIQEFTFDRFPGPNFKYYYKSGFLKRSGYEDKFVKKFNRINLQNIRGIRQSFGQDEVIIELQLKRNKLVIKIPKERYYAQEINDRVLNSIFRIYEQIERKYYKKWRKFIATIVIAGNLFAMAKSNDFGKSPECGGEGVNNDIKIEDEIDLINDEDENNFSFEDENEEEHEKRGLRL